MTFTNTPEEKVILAAPHVYACETCEVGRSYCRRPCWPTPADAKRLMDAGYGPNLMLDYWAGTDDCVARIDILCPANPGHEGKAAPEIPRNPLGLLMARMGMSPLTAGCVFFSNEGKCLLHTKGLKPTEGGLVCCKTPQGHPAEGSNLHKMVAKSWNTDEGRAAVARWKTLVCLTE